MPATRTRRSCGIASGVAALAVAGAAALPNLHAAEAAPACDRVAAPTGLDSASGTAADPFRTAQRLLDSLSTGQTGCLRSLTYAGDGPQRAFTATDNRITDPLYVDRSAKGFNLRPESPCRSLLDDSGGGPEPPPPDDPFDALTLLKEDDASDPDPLGLWGALDAADPLRHEYRTDEAQPYRRLTVLDGDDFFGERVELGELNRDEPTFMRYFEGERKLTVLRYRLPSDFPIDTKDFQVIAQMKLVGGSSINGEPPILSLQANKGKFLLRHNQGRTPIDLWTVEPVLGEWFQVAFDITYSQHADQARIVPWSNCGNGWVQHPEITGYPTLDVEPRSGYRDPQGSSIPSHLRVGIYHDPSIRGTHVDIRSVRVYE